VVEIRPFLEEEKKTEKRRVLEEGGAGEQKSGSPRESLIADNAVLEQGSAPCGEKHVYGHELE
jgi:hypothetical protein